MKVKQLIKEFSDIKFRHVPREENVRADVLSKLISTKPGGNNQSLIQETLKFPSITESLPILTIEGVSNWIIPITQYLRNGTRPANPEEAKRLAKEAPYYHMINEQLFRRGLSQSLLKCMGLERVPIILEEVHKGSCGHNLGRRSLTLKVL